MRVGLENGPSLGEMIRATRMCYTWLKAHQCFVRLSGGDNGRPFLAEVHPCGLVPNSQKRHDKFWIIEPDHQDLFEDIKLIHNLKRVKRPFQFYFDNEGETL